MSKKPIWVWPGSTRLLSGRQPVIYAGPALFLGVLGFFFSLGLGLFITWWNIPFFPLPTNQRPAMFHVLAFYNLLASWVLHFDFIKGDTYQKYLLAMDWWRDRGEINLLAFRWMFAILFAIAGGVLGFFAGARPFLSELQVSGRVLLEGKEAFNDLRRFFDLENSRTKLRGLIVAALKGFDANNPVFYDNGKKIGVIVMPDAQRRTHFAYLGGSRRGKGVTLKQWVMQIYNWIRRGKRFKLMVVDTPKGEYSMLFKAKYMVQIAPDEEFSVVHDIGKDLMLKQDAAQFFSGVIQISEKDPFWGMAGQGAGTAVMAFLQAEAGTDWGYNNFCYFKDQPSDVLAPIIDRYYPEMSQIMNMGSEPLGSVLGNLAGATIFMNDLARIWNGYDEKVVIHQMSAALLKRSYWVNFMTDKMFPHELEVEEKSPLPLAPGQPATQLVMVDISHNKCTSWMFRGLIAHLNETVKNWKWVDLKSLLALNFESQRAITLPFISVEASDLIDRSYAGQYAEHIQPFLEFAEIWDMYEAKEKISILEWTKDENPKKKILCIKPSGRFKKQTEGLIRGILFFMTGIINDKYFPEDKTKLLPQRNFHIIVDEFQSLGNLKEFIGPGLEMFASKGVTIHLACQDLSQLKAIYGDDWLQFFTANTGNIQIMGVNMGSSAEMISTSLLGKKSIEKLHTSITNQETGTSSSRNYQKHDGELVMDPSRINSDLGPRNGFIHYLYLPGNLPNAYILTAKIVDYKINYRPVEPGWMRGEKTAPQPYDYKKVLDDLLVMPKAQIPTSLEKKHQDIPDTSYLQIKDYVPDAASQMTDADMEFTEEEQTLILQNKNTSERAPLYVLPSDEGDMQGDIAKDLAVEALGGGVVSALKNVGELLSSTKRNTTTDKLKFYKAWKEKNHVDRHTQS